MVCPAAVGDGSEVSRRSGCVDRFRRLDDCRSLFLRVGKRLGGTPVAGAVHERGHFGRVGSSRLRLVAAAVRARRRDDLPLAYARTPRSWPTGAWPRAIWRRRRSSPFRSAACGKCSTTVAGHVCLHVAGLGRIGAVQDVGHAYRADGRGALGRPARRESSSDGRLDRRSRSQSPTLQAGILLGAMLLQVILWSSRFGLLRISIFGISRASCRERTFYAGWNETLAGTGALGQCVEFARGRQLLRKRIFTA